MALAIGCLGGVGNRQCFKTVRTGLFRVTVRAVANHDVGAAVPEISRLGTALIAVPQNRNRLTFEGI